MGFQRVVILLLVWVFGAVILPGQREASTMAEVTVRDVAFQQVRDARGEIWWEAAVELRVKARPGDAGKFADRVQVSLNLAVPTRGDAAQLTFYRASVSTATLAAGEAIFRYYLPPAVVERDRLSRDARFWTVDVSVADVSLAATRESVGSGFSSAAAVENFRQQLREQAPANDGVLLPLHLVPAGLLPSADPPAIRPEAAGVSGR